MNNYQIEGETKKYNKHTLQRFLLLTQCNKFTIFHIVISYIYL